MDGKGRVVKTVIAVAGRTCKHNASECVSPGEECCGYRGPCAWKVIKILGCGGFKRCHKARLGDRPHRKSGDCGENLHNASECTNEERCGWKASKY
jgi:hypothetical protein